MDRRNIFSLAASWFTTACVNSSSAAKSVGRSSNRIGIAVAPTGQKNFNERFHLQLTEPVTQSVFEDLINDLGMRWSLERMSQKYLGPRPNYERDAFAQSELEGVITALVLPTPRGQNYLDAYRAFIIIDRVVLIENHFSSLHPM
jgi:hypothetical protein